MKLMQNFPKKVIRRRLNNLELLFGEKVSSKERLSGYYQLRIEIREETRRLPRPPKFSGYIKSPSAAGSKRQLVRQLLDEMVTGEEYVDVEKVSWYNLLSVESVSLFLGRGVIGSWRVPNKERNAKPSSPSLGSSEPSEPLLVSGIWPWWNYRSTKNLPT